MKEISEQLHAPFPQGEIEWRVIRSGKGKSPYAMIAPYVDARAVTRRLDDVFGIDGWDNEVSIVGDGAVCKLSVCIADKWVSRTDGANFSNIEPIKGGISDALKRAAALFGIGKYLYYVPSPIFADLTTNKGQNAVQIDGTKYYWSPPDIDLYKVAMENYDAIVEGKPVKSQEVSTTTTPAIGSPVEPWELERMGNLPIIASDYFKAMSYTRLQAADFCRGCGWDNETIIKKVDELSSSF